MKNKSIKDSFKNSWDGIKYAFKTQRNMRLHLSIGFIVLILGWILQIGFSNFIHVIFAIALVLFAEMVNTAVEKTVDLFMSTYHPLAKIAKNVAAGAVLIAAVNAIIIGVIVFGVPLIDVLIN